MSRAENLARFAAFCAANAIQNPTPQTLREWLHVIMGSVPVPAWAKLYRVSDEMSAYWIRPPGKSPERVILYLHGGGYMAGSSLTHLEFMNRFAEAVDGIVLSVDYRLAPESAWPACVEDAVAGYRYLLAQGTKPSQIAIVGDSAGGGLTIATLQALRDAGDPLPACAVCFSPWVDFTGSGETMKTNAGKDPLVDPTAIGPMAGAVLQGKDAAASSPLFNELGGLPPLFIQVGASEPLLSDAVRLAEKTKPNSELDVWEEMVHVFGMFPNFFGAEAIAATEKAAGFVRGRLG